MHTPFKAVGKVAHKLWLHVLYWLVPPLCIGCEKPLPAQEPIGFCVSCYAKMPWWNTSHVLPPRLPPAVSSFAAPCLYTGPMREVILNFKFRDQPHLAPALAKLLASLAPPGPLLIVPVPSHRKRLRQRLYNHAALLAQSLGKIINQPANTTTLKRLKPGLPQNKKTRAQRLKLSGADFAASAAVQGHHVLLIDDIFTTGATAHACALALKRAGAARVSVLTLAYTKPE